jgi:hypothetical protein
MKKVALKETSLVNAEVISKVILNGDLKGLSPIQKVEYYNAVCKSVGLNPLTQPFEYIVLKGKEALYSKKGCAEQLRNIHAISIKVTDREKIEDVYIVTAEATNADGRTDSSTGCVNIAGLKGEDLANAFMKAETKAKRRVTLSICGLNMLDELEVQSVLSEQPNQQESENISLSTNRDEAEQPKKPKVVVMPKETTRDQLAQQIVSSAATLNLKGKELTEWIKEETGKGTKDLTHSEMETVLGKLQSEIGRM